MDASLSSNPVCSGNHQRWRCGRPAPQADDNEGESPKDCEQPPVEEHPGPPQLAPPTFDLIQEQQAKDASDEHPTSLPSSRSRTPCSMMQGAVSEDEEAVDDDSENEASDGTQISNASGWASRRAARVPTHGWGRHLPEPISPAGELADVPGFYGSELEVDGEATYVYHWQPEHPDSQEYNHVSENEVIIYPARVLEGPDPQELRSGRIVKRVL